MLGCGLVIFLYVDFGYGMVGCVLLLMFGLFVVLCWECLGVVIVIW